MIWKIPLTFCAMVILDIVWAYYTSSVAAKKPALAGLFASTIMFCTAAVTVSYVQDPRLLPVVMAGAFVGTYLAVRFPIH